MSSSVKMTVGVDRPKIPVTNVETELKCLVQLLPAIEQEAQPAKRLTSSVCLVFDCSASMLEGSKLETAIECAQLIADKVPDGCEVSLVAFQSRVTTLVERAAVNDATREQVKQQVAEIRGLAGGSTNMTDGLRVGTRCLAKTGANAKVMILLSDGAADFPTMAEKAALEATQAGVQVFAVGIGEAYRADDLLKLVRPSNGALYGSTEMEQIKVTFVELARRIEQFVITNARLDVVFHPEVAAGLAYKASPEQAFLGNMRPDDHHAVRFNVGNIEAEKLYSFLFLATAPQWDPGKLELAQCRLTYDVPSQGVVGATVDGVIEVEYTGDRRATEELNGNVMETFRRVSVAQLVDKLVEATKADDKPLAARYCNILLKRYDEIGDVAMRNHYTELLETLKADGTVTNEMLNASVVASVVAAGAGELPSLVDDEF